jgi:hypothetical protein
MSFTEQLSQSLSLVDKIDPANNATNNTAYSSSGIDMQKFQRCMFEIQIGANTGPAVLQAKLQSSATSNFASAHDMTGGSISNVANTSTNCRVTLETTAEAVQAQNSGDRYVRLAVTISGTNAAVVFGATGWGGSAPQKPAAAQDPNTVLQRLVVT